MKCMRIDLNFQDNFDQSLFILKKLPMVQNLLLKIIDIPNEKKQQTAIIQGLQQTLQRQIHLEEIYVIFKGNSILGCNYLCIEEDYAFQFCDDDTCDCIPCLRNR
ncbi:hypothetical protein PPERSA_08410 [Pseudocohnilembus persalinus]|uniref:Uncharacterized protein n=1 Tax=Pseudocohnilembus persalinus TaxID=266149 RepID=A0A0V0R696_PSEPJ|nr:hypothetical protein PPERSA_08410 [Pseudocohnilembus persalinus]|eukprot:KRX10007.1 hypothetical protein PPERSA_08410 [Pseudocohnilembus persalinus]